MIIWKDIEGYESRYEISNDGQVRNAKTKKVLSLAVKSTGYVNIGLRDVGNDMKKHFAIHRLVANAFVENSDNKPQVNHIDGNKLNNNACNLEWCTAYENTMHAFETGLRVGSDHNKCRKLGKTSIYHYVSEVKSDTQDEHFFRALVKKGNFHRSKQFSIKKYGEHEAEQLAAKAANNLVTQYNEFDGLALNVF